MAKNKVYALIIQGLVQGVGFRPFIYRIAKDLGMKGCVENMNNGARILVAATPDDRDSVSYTHLDVYKRQGYSRWVSPS